MRKHIAKRVASVVLSAAMVATLVPANMMVQQDVIIAEAASMSYSSSYKSGKYYTALTKVKLTGNPRTDIVNIAKSQIGYQEGGSSSKLSGTVRGNANCTEYGRWYGMQDMWCAMFVSWCAAVAGIPSSVVPKHAYTPTGLAQFRNQGRAWSRAKVAAGKYRPQAGDIIYFKSSRNKNTTNHIGIVTGYSNGTVYTVEGNTSSATVSTNGGAVAAKSYSINNTYIVYICQPKYSGTGSSGSAGNGTSVNTGSTSSSSTLKQGSEGEAVKSLQRNLIGLGYLNDVADGQFGSKTLAAVKSYQKAKRLTVDGLAGTQTKNALNADVKSVQSGVYKLGFTSVGSADGDYGSNTKAAVKMFQSKNGLSATGIADAATRAKISQLVGSASGTTSNPSSGSTGTTTAAGNVSSSDMAVIRKIIYAVETGGQVYGNARYDDFTPAYKNSSIEHAITIGAGQWYATEAKTLLNLIRKTDPATFKKLDTAGIASDLDNKNWSTYRISKTSAKAKCIQKIISSSVGKKCQDQLIDEQMIKYMKEAYKLGVTDLAAQMMCANYRHQGGTGAMKRILNKTSKPYTVDKLYNSSKSDTGNQVGAYKSRQKMVYNSLTKYIGSGKTGVTSSTTLESIYGNKGTTSSSSSSNTSDPSVFETSATLEKGSTGAQVEHLQRGLIGLGYLNDTADGDFGTKTETAVKAYQKAKGLEVDGKAGKNTLTKLKSEVQTLQENLKKLGLYSDTADGIYGSNTKASVKKFQEKYGLTADGIANSKTLAKVKTAISDTSSSNNTSSNSSSSNNTSSNNTSSNNTSSNNTNSNSSSSNNTSSNNTSSNSSSTTVSTKFKTTGNLKQGSTGNQVEYVQRGLIGLGYLKDTVDGNYGPNTEAAVKKYQKAKGLKVDGIAGANTLAKLKSEVVTLQQNLKKLGFYSGTIDGIYGSSTTTAVKNFQKKYSLTVDGIAGSKTLTKITSVLNPKKDTFEISASQKSLVFDATYYANKYSDLKAAYGTNATKLYEHFITHGIKEGRQGCAAFSVKTYLNKYSDLKAAYGTDYTKAVEHYLVHGYKEGRRAPA